MTDSRNNAGQNDAEHFTYKCPNCGGMFDEWEHPFGGAAACPFCLKEQGDYE